MFSKKVSCTCCSSAIYDTAILPTNMKRNLKNFGWKKDVFVCKTCADKITDGVPMDEYSHGSFFITHRTVEGSKFISTRTSLKEANEKVQSILDNGGVIDRIVLGVKVTSNMGNITLK